MSFDDWARWLAVGLVLMALETQMPGAFMVWIGLAALGTGAVAFALDASFGVQVLVFAGLAALSVSVALWQRRGRARSKINTPQSGLVGREVKVLSLEGERLRVRLGDSDWPARLGHGTTAPGARLIVTAVEGMVLVLAPSEE